MKFIIFPIFSTVFAIAHSKALSNVTETSKLYSNIHGKNDFDPKKSLAFLIDGKQFLYGGAILSKLFVLTLASHLQKFILDKTLITSLSVGIGTDTFDANSYDYRHAVTEVNEDKRKGDDINRRLAIVTVVPNRDEVPGNGQNIPLPLFAYKNGYEKLEKVSVGWDKNGRIRKDYITNEIIQKDVMKANIASKDKQGVPLSTTYYGGFITFKGTLVGMTFHFSTDTSNKKLTNVEINYVIVEGSSEFIRKFLDDDITYKDIYKA